MTSDAEVIESRNGYPLLNKRLNLMELGTENINTLKLLPALPNVIVSTKYYKDATDKGAGTYKIVDNTGLTADDYSLIDLANGLQAQLIITDAINVRLFGALGDSTADDTQAFKRAIAYAENLKDDTGLNRFIKGISIYVPDGTYKLTEPLVIKKSGINIIGESSSGTILYSPDATFDGIVFDGSTLALYNSTINNIKLYRPGNSTAGCGIRFINVINSINSNVEIAGAFEGVEVNSCGKIYINKFLVTQTNRSSGTAVGYQIKVLGDLSTPGDIHFSDVQVTPSYLNQDYTMLIRASDGLYFDNFHIHGGVLIEPRGTMAGTCEDTLASIFFNNSYFDNAKKYNIWLKGNATNYRNIFFNNSYIRGAVTGLYISTETKLQMLQVRGGKVGGQLQHGIFVENSNFADSTFAHIAFENNNRSGLSDGTDVLIRGNGIIADGTTHYNDNPRPGYLYNLGSASSNCLVTNIMGTNSKVTSNNYKVTNSGTNNTVGTVI
ncbi:glycosyl hydrolase family 28-related protein [Streptococcus uberis]|uniref:glycosyl hydrolase family 28-related protein n=1 Tax=Streptococcus uberis TaxID=1349 RepID=UPI001939A71F|nr:glycosyl hydrolase family 28-related protein [Streptococcus uberis]